MREFEISQKGQCNDVIEKKLVWILEIGLADADDGRANPHVFKSSTRNVADYTSPLGTLTRRTRGEL